MKKLLYFVPLLVLAGCAGKAGRGGAQEGWVKLDAPAAAQPPGCIKYEDKVWLFAFTYSVHNAAKMDPIVQQILQSVRFSKPDISGAMAARRQKGVEKDQADENLRKSQDAEMQRQQQAMQRQEEMRARQEAQRRAQEEAAARAAQPPINNPPTEQPPVEEPPPVENPPAQEPPPTGGGGDSSSGG